MSNEVNHENLRAGWKPGQSGNPHGRPRGSRNKATLLAQAILDEDAEAIARAVVQAAKAGDMTAARLVLDRLVPPARERPIALTLPEDISTVHGLERAQEAVLRALVSGELLPGEASTLFNMVEAKRKALSIRRSDDECILIDPNPDV